MALMAFTSRNLLRSVILPSLAKLANRPGCGKSAISGALPAVDGSLDGGFEFLRALVGHCDARLGLEIGHGGIEFLRILINKRSGCGNGCPLELAGHGARQEIAGGGGGNCRRSGRRGGCRRSLGRSGSAATAREDHRKSNDQPGNNIDLLIHGEFSPRSLESDS